MKIKTKLRERFISLTGYWIYKHSQIPVGCDIISDLKHKLFPDLKTIFDIGANIGQTAIKFNDYFKESNIYSFEPVSKTFQELKINTSDLNQVKCFKFALGDKIENVEINIFDEKDSVLNSLKKESQNKNAIRKEKIEVITGDFFCSENNISEIDLLKIDTEGFEIQVLEGFKKMIKESRIKAFYCEVGFSPNNFRNTYINDLFDFSSKNNFTFYGLYEVYNKRIKTGNNFGNILFINNDYLKFMT